ncbi:MAG TPA: endonuclease/exonuclease/phosphatase family protein, partial [Ilumatobacteraceae bacterium]|nr:endonuclease/exonuclease/phosphatase family protein [Ilumatobacteraceae bacterium]
MSSEHADPVPPTPSSWVVLTWNVHGSARPDLDEVASAIRAESPDVAVLQEVRKRQAASLAASLQMRYSWSLKHSPYTKLMWWRAEGLAIMTPHLLDAVGHTEVSDEQPMRSWRRRIVQWGLVGRADRSMLMIYNLHLSPHDDADSRRDEAARVNALVATIGDDPPAVVAGDFNDADDPTVIDLLPGIEHVVPPMSNPAHAPNQRLDHVLLPAHARDVNVSVPAGGPDWAAISDHLPVTVRFTLPM